MTTHDDLTTIMSRATSAFSVMRSSARVDRARWLEAAAAALDAAAIELVDIAARESHLARPRLEGELVRTTKQLRFFARVVLDGAYLEAMIDHADPTAQPPTPDLRRMLVPIGPVAVFAASNFPFAFSVAGGDTASAIAAGNPVVVKAHPGHLELSRRVAEVLERALREAGAPEGVLALVEGREAATALVEHPATAAVGFTGSIPGGRALFDLAARRPVPIPFFGELGSLNPVVITAAAVDRRGPSIVQGLVASFTLGAGQFCTKPGIVFAPVGSDLPAAVAEAVGAVAAQHMLMPRIAEGFRDGLRALAAQPGVSLVAGEIASDETVLEPQPVVLRATANEVLAEGAAVLEECFGPAVVIVEYEPSELLPALSALPGGLTATLHSEAEDDIDAVLGVLEQRAGRVLFDGWPTGVAVAWAQHHGGPYPATTSTHTSVGATAIRRFVRPIAYQDAPQRVLPAELRDDLEGTDALPRRIDGVLG